MINNAKCNIAENIASLYSIPIPLQAIVEEEDLIILYDDYGSNTFDGMTWYEPDQGQFYIHINTTMGNKPGGLRTRFTLAHELGHYFIDHHRNALIAGVMKPHCHKFNPFGKNEEWQIEREADDFAASLLMPAHHFIADIKGEKFSGHLIDKLSHKYKVSFSSCALRCLDLNHIPLMLVYAEDSKIKWQRHSDDFPFYQLKYGYNRVPENTVMGEYFLKQDDSCSKQDEIVYAGDCFHTFKEDQNRMEFYEYCIPYKNKCFSIFWERD